MMEGLSENARLILQQRYLQRNSEGKVTETPEEMFARVARHVASGERNYRCGSSPDEVEEKFFEVMTDLDFLPNSPTLMNAGTRLGQLAACFVLPVEDSIKGIFRAVSEMAVIHQSGGGTGFSFSCLRPEGDVVKSTGGIASGPVSFMQVFDRATEVVKQGGGVGGPIWESSGPIIQISSPLWNPRILPKCLPTSISPWRRRIGS